MKHGIRYAILKHCPLCPSGFEGSNHETFIDGIWVEAIMLGLIRAHTICLPAAQVLAWEELNVEQGLRSCRASRSHICKVCRDVGW